MDIKHMKLITDNITELISNTHDIETIIDKLESTGILNIYMKNYLQKFRDHKTKTEAFYEMIQGRGPHAFDSLLCVLRETENFRVEQKLLSHKCIPNNSRVQSNQSISSDVFSDFKIHDINNISIHIKSSEIFLDIDENHHPGGAYRMRSKPRGIALIINIFKTPHFQNRTGSEIDTIKLEKLFSGLGYVVQSFTDLSVKEMRSKITSFRNEVINDVHLSKIDSIAIFIMSHGRQHKDRSIDLLASDGNILNTSWITEQLTGKYSPFFNERERKPKLFFFQACRGSSDLVINATSSNFTVDTDSAIIPEQQDSKRSIEDSFIIFSTTSGCHSMRDRNGAWFVNLFCKIVSEYAYMYDLDTMLGMVDDELRNMNSKEFGYQTLEVVKQGAFKKLFFNPGLFEEIL